jgi:hypothetical protein
MLHSSIVVQHFASRRDLLLGRQELFQKWDARTGLPYQSLTPLENHLFLPVGQSVWEYLIPRLLVTFLRHIKTPAPPDSFFRLFPL